MKNIVISLKTATARREHICKEFGKQNINFDFFDALTPDLAKPLAEKMHLNVGDEYLTGGELACFMSHVSVWQKMVDEQIPYIAVFEDDIFWVKMHSQFLVHLHGFKKTGILLKLKHSPKKFYWRKIHLILKTLTVKLNG
ncbi:glycosyltransferase family 25 protein [Acinetobacter variabilis]|nr:glycosyltransferase family 25 protein [Acinetobacter variabilis]